MRLSESEILKKEGIIVRLIPKTTTRVWTSHVNGKKIQEKQVKTNSLGGKYLVEFMDSQDCICRFNLKYSGIGDTIEEAYYNLLEK